MASEGNFAIWALFLLWGCWCIASFR